jgi:hypothetical protein
LKVALERLLGGTCHHMVEVFPDPDQMAGFTAAIEGRPVDWHRLMDRFTTQVDWPGASFWPELSAAFPDSLVILSVRDPAGWYRSASATIFQGMELAAVDGGWMGAMKRLLAERFSDRFDDEAAMIEAYLRHNDAVREKIPASRLLEWTPADGWEPICTRLGVAVPDEPFPMTNTTEEFRAMIGLPPLVS